VQESKKVFSDGSSTEPMLLAVGFVISFLVGLVALALLVRWIGKGKLYYFAFYLIPMGICVICWQLLLKLGYLGSGTG